jgi:hypothetical protein
MTTVMVECLGTRVEGQQKDKVLISGPRLLTLDYRPSDIRVSSVFDPWPNFQYQKLTTRLT